MQLLSGNLVSKELKLEIKLEVEKMIADGTKKPHLAAILLGNDGASMTYVAAKEKDCTEVGFNSTVLRFPPSITEKELLAEVEKINNNDEIDIELEFKMKNLALFKAAKVHGCNYAFGVTVALVCRRDRRTLRNLGYDVEIVINFPWKEKKVYNFVKMFPMYCKLQ